MQRRIAVSGDDARARVRRVEGLRGRSDSDARRTAPVRREVSAAARRLVRAHIVPVNGFEVVAIGIVVGDEQRAAVPSRSTEYPSVDRSVRVARARLQRRFESVDVASRNEIDDTRDGIGAVDRRSAVRKNLDALERERRNDVRIGEHVVDSGYGHAMTVQQDQRAVRRRRAEAMYRRGIGAGAVEAAVRRLPCALQPDDGRHSLQDLLNCLRARVLDVVPPNGDEIRADGCHTPQARARDDDFFDVRRCRIRGVLRTCRAADAQSRNDR